VTIAILLVWVVMNVLLERGTAAKNWREATCPFASRANHASFEILIRKFAESDERRPFVSSAPTRSSTIGPGGSRKLCGMPMP
jgi:hypothetical protein